MGEHLLEFLRDAGPVGVAFAMLFASGIFGWRYVLEPIMNAQKDLYTRQLEIIHSLQGITDKIVQAADSNKRTSEMSKQMADTLRELMSSEINQFRKLREDIKNGGEH